MFNSGESVMHLEKTSLTIKPLEAAIAGVLLLIGISYGIIKLGLVPHVPIMLAIISLLVYGLLKKVSFKELEAGMVNGAKSGIGAIFIFFFIGMLISSWMAAGTIPTMIYIALGAVTGQFFYAIVFTVTAVVGLSIGSSLTTAATIGVAFISISQALGLSIEITAGAVISGAFFGDKLSPLSDTTNLASSVVKADLFEHIRNMLWTTVPAFIISFFLFAMLSPRDASTDFAEVDFLKNTLVSLNLVHWYSLIPFLLMAGLAIKKVSALLTLSAGTISAVGISIIVNNVGLGAQLEILFSGFKSDSGVEEVDALLSRGGMESMMFSVSLILLALSMGGLLFQLGIIPAILNGMKTFIKRTSAMITSAALSAIGINLLVGEQYLSILLTGTTFRDHFEKAGLHPKNLSRVLEDAGTVVNPLVPWSVCGVFLTGVLGVSTVDYLPFAFFCLASPLLTIFFGMTGITITKQLKS